MTWLKAIPGALRLVPSWIWILLALAIAFRFAVSWHSGKVEAIVLAAKREQLALDQAAVDEARARAREHKRKIETKDAARAREAEEAHAKTVTRLDAAYDELRRQPAPRVQAVGRGSGSLPGLSNAAGVADGAAGGSLRDLAPLADAGLAVVPWLGLVDQGQSCDVDRARLAALQKFILETSANHGGEYGE